MGEDVRGQRPGLPITEKTPAHCVTNLETVHVRADGDDLTGPVGERNRGSLHGGR